MRTEINTGRYRVNTSVYRRVSVLLATLVTALLLSNMAAAQYFYRYKDENGTMVMDISIPAEYVSAGYEVLDAQTGRVIERVDASVTDDMSVINVYLTPDDHILLASYSTIEEIEDHLERKLVKFRAEVANIQTDIRVSGLELDKQHAELKRLQDRERDIPEELAALIRELEQSLVGLAAALERRKVDYDSTTAEYEAKISRFQVLKSADELL